MVACIKKHLLFYSTITLIMLEKMNIVIRCLWLHFFHLFLTYFDHVYVTYSHMLWVHFLLFLLGVGVVIHISSHVYVGVCVFCFWVLGFKCFLVMCMCFTFACYVKFFWGESFVIHLTYGCML